MSVERFTLDTNILIYSMDAREGAKRELAAAIVQAAVRLDCPLALQAIGLAWGWQSLTQTAPLNAPAFDPSYQYRQIIILLTDGLNTQDRWYGNGSQTSTQVDSRMYDSSGNGTCANAARVGTSRPRSSFI